MGQYRIPADVAGRVRAGHPWVFRDALGARGVAEPTGAVVELLSGNRDFVGRGYVDRDHAIAVRVLARDPDERRRARQRRRSPRASSARPSCAGSCSARALPEAMRVFSGESEGLPGVTVDRYGDFVVVQWLSAGALPWRDELYGAIESRLAAARDLRAAAGAAARRRRLRPSRPCARAATRRRSSSWSTDGGCRFGVDVTAPLGVGLFPDMRLGWAAVAARAAGRRVLNLFSYTGAFSVHAAKAGAAEVVAVDTAAKAHARARRNFELSGLDRRAPRGA